MRDILRGGIDKMAEAGVPIIGGHSIKDAEIKAGFAVTGLVDPARMMTNDGARPGDVLVLTKPLGTGIIAFADQIDRAPPGALDAAARSMTALNKTASEVMLGSKEVHACTDITGFGLTGHLVNIAAASGVDMEIVWDDLPLLPGVLECVGQGIIPGGVERNRESSAANATLGKGVEPVMLDVCVDPQTSGGLLIAVASRRAKALVERLHEAGIAEAAAIGRVKGKGSGRIFVETRGTRPIQEISLKREAACCDGTPAGGHDKEDDMKKSSSGSGCCSAHAAKEGLPKASGGTAEIRTKFQEFLKAANAPGALDPRTKQAMALALSVLAKCEPCTRNHLQKARDMGFSEAEIDEAVWMAIAFGGSPVMMFYESIRRA
jgi:selenide,water dikinase